MANYFKMGFRLLKSSIIHSLKFKSQTKLFCIQVNKQETSTNLIANPNTNTSSSGNNRIVRKLNRRFNSRTYTCIISPDRTTLLITPDYEFNYSYSHHTHSHAESTIIININTCQLLRVIPARCDQRFAFDPRYGLPNYQGIVFIMF